MNNSNKRIIIFTLIVVTVLLLSSCKVTENTSADLKASYTESGASTTMTEQETVLLSTKAEQGQEESMTSVVTEEVSEPTGYYKNAYNLRGDVLKSALNDIITENHATLNYDQVYSALEDTDEDPEDSSKLILFYKGVSVGDNELRMSDNGDIWNREHIWAKSHGDFGTKRGPGTDLHMIRPTDASVNARRGHLDFDESDQVFKEAPDTYVDDDSFEPRDEVKGDVARMLFYMAVRYEGEEGEVDLELSNRTDTFYRTQAGYGEHGKLDTLLKWHEEDPVDDFEIRRNEVVHKIQGNRNPFIDHPEYVGLIWGDGNGVEVSEHAGQAGELEQSEQGNEGVQEYSVIDQAREMSDGEALTVVGTVTYVESNTTLYVQDDTGGLRVDSYGSKVELNDYETGQRVAVNGRLDTYKAEKEIRIERADDIELLESAFAYNPKIVSVRSLRDGKNQGQIIQLDDVKVTAIHKNVFEIEDEGGYTMNVYYGKKVDITGIDEGMTYSFVGIASWYNEVQVKLMKIID